MKSQLKSVGQPGRNPSRRCSSLAVLLAMSAMTGLSAPMDVYVTPTGAGDKDGRDWNNAMSNITAAYGLCAANADGGTVHLAGGIYRSTGWSETEGNFTVNAAIVPASNVTLCGSEDKDNPTILTGDRELNNLWWDDATSERSPQWVDGRLVEPDANALVFPHTQSALHEGKFCESDAGVENCQFRHLTFHGFKGTSAASPYVAPVVSLSNARGVVFDGCRFIGIGESKGWLPHDASTPIVLTSTSATITNCTFVGNRNGVKISSPTAQVSVKISDCTFRSNRFAGGYGTKTLLLLDGNASVLIENTSFSHNSTETASTAIAATTLATPLVVKDSSFTCCFGKGSGVSRGAICRVKVGGDFSGCLFVSNRVEMTNPSDCSAACVQMENTGTLNFIDCYFAHNELAVASGGSSADASIVACYLACTLTMVNCTAEANTSTGSVNSCTVGGWRTPYFSMANCVFRNNDCINAEGARVREFVNIWANSYNAGPAMFVNSIIWHDAADYIPFAFGTATCEPYTGFASCDIRNYTPGSVPTGCGFQYQPILGENPQFAASPRIVGTRGACQLTAETPKDIRKKGVKVCRATTGDFYFLDTNKNPNEWRKIARANTTALSLGEGEAIGLTTEMAAYPDVFGGERRSEQSMGPFDFQVPPGFTLFVR